MLAFEITLNAFIIVAAVFFAFLIGFMLRGNKVAALKDKIAGLETEMLNNHANILQLQREKALLENQLQQSDIPVIPITAAKDDKDNANKATDAGLRKKLASPGQSQKHS